MKQLYVVVTLFIFCVMGCTSEESTNYEHYQSALEGVINKHYQYENYLLIPGEGCSGCISGATYFAIEHKDENQFGVIFTGVEDSKMLALKVGRDFLQDDQVFIDKKDKFKHPEIASIYPQWISTTSNQVSEVSIFENALPE